MTNVPATHRTAILTTTSSFRTLNLWLRSSVILSVLWLDIVDFDRSRREFEMASVTRSCTALPAHIQSLATIGDNAQVRHPR